MTPADATPNPGFLVRRWARLPLPIRAIAGGLFVFATLQFGWNALVLLNMKVSPTIPWHAPLGLAYLWVLFELFNGRWGARSTREARKQSMRARRMRRAEWGSATIASVAVLVFLTLFLMFMLRLFQIPDEGLDLDALPWWNKLSILLMIAIVAGVSEEAGFRGYLQGPLERRYGPGVAIGTTAVLFWMAHLNHPSAVVLLPALLVAGITFGVLAYCARSIFPGILVHAAVDIVSLVGSTFELGSRSFWEPPLLRDSGADAGFLTMLALTVLSGIAMVVAMRRLAARTRSLTAPAMAGARPGDSVRPSVSL